MNHSQALIESRRAGLLAQLRASESALRGATHVNGTDAIARAHLERALAHVNEAFIAINEAGRARTVKQLVEDVERVEKLCEELKQQPPPGVTVKPLRA